ncbi:MAG TPA: hypothetical protein VFR24_14290 [Candidatus Angelobacter sp.]|jgi:hypothetical protein|nr:hypothetical protein [Candidatus Angelobacter sp.]
MWWRAQTRGQRIALLILIIVALVLFVPRIYGIFASNLGLALVPIYLLAYLFALIALPLMLFALLKFVYSVFARPYLRLFRMRRYRNNKYLREAMKRGR